MSDLPEYERRLGRMRDRAAYAAGCVEQVRLTAGPYLAKPLAECRVIDVGAGYGYTAAELARHCASVVALEPTRAFAEHAAELARDLGLDNLDVRAMSVEALDDDDGFDLAVLDNVLEHIPDQRCALERVSDCLRPGGVAFILVPNKLWPIEAHYRLPFLSYLPLPLANAYLRASGRGVDYEDASYAPTYFGLRRMLRRLPNIDAYFVPPADVGLAQGGDSLLYRAGVAALRRAPFLWAVAKALLVVAVKR